MRCIAHCLLSINVSVSVPLFDKAASNAAVTRVACGRSASVERAHLSVYVVYDSGMLFEVLVDPLCTVRTQASLQHVF
jgi:hypothetical protein